MPVLPLLAASLAFLSPVQKGAPPLTSSQKEALNAISSGGLKSHVSFLASDLLEGRNTPSKGLDLAAEYISGHFLRAGVTPGVGESYYQMNTWKARNAAPSDPGVPVKNIIGVIPGTDPKLKDTYILVTAHYDHIGMKANAQPGEDAIFNGANDNASSTSGIIELAYALSKSKPKRTIVLMLFYGEEKGLVGSFFYARNPVFPLKQTIANVNVEQIGRVDDLEAPRRLELSMTGYDFTDVGTIFSAAAKPFGVEVTKHPKNSDSFFGRSDNVALAMFGIPAHTICTAFEFPDYHGLGDEASKLDYENMVKVARAIGAGVLALANSPTAPKWDSLNPKVKRYSDAWIKLQGDN